MSERALHCPACIRLHRAKTAGNTLEAIGLPEAMLWICPTCQWLWRGIAEGARTVLSRFPRSAGKELAGRGR